MSDDQAIYITPIWTGAAPKRVPEVGHCVTPTCQAKLSHYNLDCRPFCYSCYSTYNNQMITMTIQLQESGLTWRKASRKAEGELRPDWFPSGGPWSRV